MRLSLPIGVLLVTVTTGAIAVAAWASIADAPWEGTNGNPAPAQVPTQPTSPPFTSLLCQDALERRKAVEDALQRPVSPTGAAQIPLSALRDVGRFRDEVTRLESKLRDIERDIQRFCD